MAYSNTLFSDIYNGRKVLITGHTGFKGSWLALWLLQLGAKVFGLANQPNSSPNHYDLLKLKNKLHGERLLDIRDERAVNQAIHQWKPEVVFHLAAQSLVLESYQDPLATWSSNVMGTANILNASRFETSVKAIVVVTTDKCYENREWNWGYREIDRLGGRDPYSSSKAAVELLVSSFRSSFFNIPNTASIATVRAGNVIGGGDWSKARLIPDLVRAIEAQQYLEIRSPKSTRPWQHVLDCISGYLVLGQRLLQAGEHYAGPWNFGPSQQGNLEVEKLLEQIKVTIAEVRWVVSQDLQPYEARQLYLDSSKARKDLNWSPVWDLNQTIKYTAEWYQQWLIDGQIKSEHQIEIYIKQAMKNSCSWAGVT